MSGDQRLVLPTRRTILKGATGAAALGLVSPFPMPALAQGAPLKVGFMLPYTGTFAKLGKFIDDAFRLKVEQNGGKLGGRAGRLRAGRRRVRSPRRRPTT